MSVIFRGKKSFVRILKFVSKIKLLKFQFLESIQKQEGPTKMGSYCVFSQVFQHPSPYISQIWATLGVPQKSNLILHKS